MVTTPPRRVITGLGPPSGTVAVAAALHRKLCCVLG
ncbi:hypothetical protein HEB94_003792 [Actinopolymorpha pittospori]|uniref:Uncharacterized protein n=1 Tax=Actinopolymorpha pittospori TaxID=648752 RepID=A0A927MVE3_9ACTN|nr:hypothetical protein [Actinopolymorpha pittospori]